MVGVETKGFYPPDNSDLLERERDRTMQLIEVAAVM